MKRPILGMSLIFLSLIMFVPSVLAGELAVAAPQTEIIDKNQLEGWIIGVDYTKSHFRLLDPRGFQRRVVTKLGIIGDYRLGDKVRVEIDPGYKRAVVIEKLN